MNTSFSFMRTNQSPFAQASAEGIEAAPWAVSPTGVLLYNKIRNWS